MKGRVEGRFISLADIYVAYRKAKVEAYYENTHFHAVAFTAYEQNIHQNLMKLYRVLNTAGHSWASDLKFIGGFAYLPKSVDCAAWDNHGDGHFRALDPVADWKQRFERSGDRATARFRLVIRPTVDFQVVSALWILKVGHLFDGAIDARVSYANRLRRRSGSVSGDARVPTAALNFLAAGIFTPYFSAYRKWREDGLKAIETSLTEEKSILAVTMDIEQFYHRVSPKFLIREGFLASIKLQLQRQEYLFTEALLRAIDVWYKSTPDFGERPQGATPVGLSASKIIANVLLVDFDKAVIDRVQPIHYGRYVDDIFLVFENPYQLTTAKSVADHLAATLAPEVVIEENSGSVPSLKLRLPYAEDSNLLFVGKKQKIFALSSLHGLDLIHNIREQIRMQSSEYRLLPEVPEAGSRMAAKALLATPDATLQADALRKADVVSVKRLGLSLLIRDLEAYSGDLRPESWHGLRTEFYGLVNRHVLTPSGFFEFFGYLPRVFGLMLVTGDTNEAKALVDRLLEIGEVLRSTTTAGEVDGEEKFSLCLLQYAFAFLQAGLQAATARDVCGAYLGVLQGLSRLGPDIHVPASVHRLGVKAREILLADWGRRPYKDYWYRSQKTDEPGPPLPSQPDVRRAIRVNGIGRFIRRAEQLPVPHWPALAFSTRPLRVDEIGLVAPKILSDGKGFREAIFVLRGARISSSAKIGADCPRMSGPAVFVVPGERGRAVRVAITSFETQPAQWAMAARGKPDRSLERYANLNSLVNRILREKQRPDYIVFPELSLPIRWALRIARKLSINKVSLIAGVEYHRRRKVDMLRNDCLVALATTWPGYASHIAKLQPKFLPAHGERSTLEDLNLGKQGGLFEPGGLEARPTVYIHGGFVFSVLVCSDLTNIAHRHELRGEIDALFVLEWNTDIKTFGSLVEATANDLHAYVVQVNNRLYGDSRLRVAAKEDYLRDVVRVKGGAADYYVLGDIDYLGLRHEQRETLTEHQKFKPLPIGYKMSRRRKIGK